MPQFIVYEVWTRSYVVEAADETAALGEGPREEGALSLCNWHAVEVPTLKAEPALRAVNALKPQ